MPTSQGGSRYEVAKHPGPGRIKRILKCFRRLTIKEMLKSRLVDLDVVLAALAHPIRRAIVERLAQGECTVKELAEPHDVSLPAISQHLRVLEDAGILRRTPDGRVRRCALRTEPLSAAFSWFLQYRMFWEDQLDAIQELVEGDRT